MGQKSDTIWIKDKYSIFLAKIFGTGVVRKFL